jgi:alpha-galactosidase
MTFSAKHLPSTLHLDPSSGIISGRAPLERREYTVELTASNAAGKTERVFKIVVADKISLTPQMGWNDWYTHYDHVTDRNIRTAADTMISSGMADYGYQFISIDDGWATKPGSKDPELNGPARNANGAILPNKRFPDMAGLTAYIHAKGLRAGIYTSPGPLTCAEFEGSYGHESEDATQFKGWGFDLLKYDWCSYDKVSGGRALDQLKKPYILMGKVLTGLDRDIVYNMCQYGMGNVWEWGSEVGGNSWRSTGDVGAIANTDLPGFYAGGLDNAAHDKYAGPGGWNDPDYILIGTVGDPKDFTAPEHKSELTAEEQYSYMSMWSLMASPLFFTGDMAKLDKQTLNVLCNAEVLDVDQDALGKQGKVVRHTEEEFILAKPLEDGSTAVGLFNLSKVARTITIPWSELGSKETMKVRDLWRQQDLGKFSDSFKIEVPSHGVAMLRVSHGRGR